MGLPAGIWPLFTALLWVVEALPAGGLGKPPPLRNPPEPAVGTAGNPPASDEILHINQELIPPEAPGSSFLLEGDIVKASPFRVFSSASPKWPKRRGTVQIPYILSYKYDKPSVDLIKEAFADFAKFTCIKFVPYSYQRDFISIMPMSGCFSSIGRTGGMQVVSLAPACLRRGKGVTLHELMHVVGFWHEHSRADRDQYIRISWNEILTGFEINFMKSWNSNMLVDYDYSSVMHYGRYAFSMTGLPTITPRSGPDVALGQRWNLSNSDIARVNKLYKCSPARPETVLLPESPTESTSQETRMDFIPNEPEPCPTEGEIQVSTSSPGTKPPETGQSTRRTSSQMTRTPKAGTEELLERTPMDVEGLSLSLTPVRGVQPVTFEPTRLSTQGMAYLEATGKPPPPPMEMGTVGAEEKPLIPTEETLLLGTESINKPDLTTVLVPPLGVAWLSGVTSPRGKAAEGLGTTEVPTEALAGLEFPELVSPAGVTPVETGGTKPGEVGLAETTSVQGTEMAHLSTYPAQKRPSPATEVGVVTLSSNQTVSLEIPAELVTAETTSSSEESSGTYTATLLFLGPPPPEPGSATETPPLTNTEKWTTNLARLTSAKSMAPGRTGSAPTWEIHSGEMETIAVRDGTEQTSLLHPVHDWTSSPTKQGNQSASSQAYSPGSHEQSTIVMPLVGMAETEATEAVQPTSFEMVQNHTIHPVEMGVQGATTRHKKGTALSSGTETTSVVPLEQATTSMETQMELGFVEATKIKASYHYGSPSRTEGTFFPVTRVKDGEYAAEVLPVDWVSRASEPAEMGMQATKINYRNEEGVRTNAPVPVGGSSPTAIGLSYTTPSWGFQRPPVTNPPSGGPAEATRSEARNQVSLSTRSPPEMGIQEASNTPPNGRKELMDTPASVLTFSIAAELGFMEHPTREASGLETPVPQASRQSEMVATGVSPAWTEAKDQFSSLERAWPPLFQMSSATEKGHSTQSLESASLPEVEIEEHRVHYRTGAGLVTLTPPQSRPRSAPMPSVEMPGLTVPEKVTPVHTEPTANRAPAGIKNTSLSFVGERPSLQTEPTNTPYPAEGPSWLQASPQTFSSIEPRLSTSSKPQMHGAVSSGESWTPLEGIPTASVSSCELCGSRKALSTQASETPTLRREEAEGKGKTFPLSMGTIQPSEKTTYRNPVMGITESRATEIQPAEASLAQQYPSSHVEATSFPMANPSVNAPLPGTSETPTTHSVLTWEPIAQVGHRWQMITPFPKASPLTGEHLTKITSLEATADSGLVETTGMEAKEHGSPGARTSQPLSEGPEVTSPPETSTTTSAEMGVRKRSRWRHVTAHSTEGISQVATEPTYVMVPEEPGTPTVSPDSQTAEVIITKAGNQLRLSISSSRMGMGAQDFKGEPRRDGRPSPTLPSGGRTESLVVEPSLKSKVLLLLGHGLRKGWFPLKQTQGMKSTESVTPTEESPLVTETWQWHQAQTGTHVPAVLSLRTEQAPRAHPAREETSLPTPQLTQVRQESDKLLIYRETSTEGMLPVDTEGKATFPEALGTLTTNTIDVVGTKEATSSPRKQGRGEISVQTPTGKASAIERYWGPSKVTSTTGHLETQSISPTELATMKIPFFQREASSTEELNLPVTRVGYGPFLEALTKTTTQAVLGLQEVKSSPRKPGRVPIPGEGTKAMYRTPSQERPEAPVTHPSTAPANMISIGASTSPLSTSTEMNGQEAPSSHEPRNGDQPYTITPAGTGPVTRESEHGGHPTKGTLVQETQSTSPHTSSATETTATQTTAPSLLNTEEGAPIADAAPEVVGSTRGVLLLEAPENKTVSVREVAMEEARSYGEGGLSTTHPQPSDTLSAETAEQVQSTQINEQMLPENGPTSHPEQGTGKPTPTTILTGGEKTGLPSMGGMSSLEAETHWLDLAAGTSLQEASPHQTFSPTELQIKTINGQETPTVILHGEDYGQTPTSPEGMGPAGMDTLELLGLFTKTVSTQSPETTSQRLEEIGVFHRETGRGKPSPLSIGTTLSAEKETVLASSKITLGMEALAGQTELGFTKVSGSQLLGSPVPAKRTSAPGAEETGVGNKVPSNGTGTPAIPPGETREPIPTARTPSAGTEATGQSYSTTVGTTVKAAETPSSPSERRGYIATGGYRKKNGEQAYTHSTIGSRSSAGSDTSPFTWPLYNQTALASTEPGKTPIESGSPSPAGGIPSGEVEPTYVGSDLESQPASPPGRGNGGIYTPSAEGGVTPVGDWDLGNEISTLEWRSSLFKKWALNTTLANGGLSTPQVQMLRERRPTSSAVGVMPTSGAKEAHGITVTQLKRAFRKRPHDQFAVDLHKELLHLVGKRSLPDAAPRHDSDPDLRGVALKAGDSAFFGVHGSNTPRKLRAKALKAFPKQHVLLQAFPVTGDTGLHPAAREIRSLRNAFEPGTSESAPDHTRGLFGPKELLLGRQKTTSLAPFLLSAKAVQATAPPAMDKPSAAALPRRQSGSGKHAHHILPGQRATAQPGWQICDFEEDLCHWQQSDADDFDWILAGERPSAGPAMGGNISEETHSSPAGGGYISLKSASARRTPGQKTSLISPILHRLGCIHFWYSPLGSIMGTINLYLKLAEAPEWHRIWFAEGQQGTDWYQVSVEASESQKLQVMVEGVVGPAVGSDVGIDGLAVCEAACWGGCAELMALDGERNEHQTK